MSSTDVLSHGLWSFDAGKANGADRERVISKNCRANPGPRRLTGGKTIRDKRKRHLGGTRQSVDFSRHVHRFHAVSHRYNRRFNLDHMMIHLPRAAYGSPPAPAQASRVAEVSPKSRKSLPTSLRSDLSANGLDRL